MDTVVVVPLLFLAVSGQFVNLYQLLGCSILYLADSKGEGAEGET